MTVGRASRLNIPVEPEYPDVACACLIVLDSRGTATQASGSRASVSCTDESYGHSLLAARAAFIKLLSTHNTM
jgi:hypothetical protein